MKESFNKQLQNLFLLGLMIFCTGAIFAQQGIINGTVTDANGDPIIGANVYIEGTTQGTVSDIDGNFSLPDITAGSVQLSVSFIGYLTETQTVTVGDGVSVEANFILIEDLQQLSEVVVIGYGTIKKSDLTGAIGTVKPEELTQLATVDVQQAMQGRVAGVMVTTNTGAPGDGVRVRIRGNSTINNSDPLYVVDGFPLGDISYLNPGDIESMEILKDASATAIYGNRGANGVVLITTKKGKEQKTTITFDMYTGMQQVNKKIPVLDAQGYAAAKRIAYHNQAVIRGNPNLDIQPGSFRDSVYNEVETSGTSGTDWQDQIFRQGIIQNYTLGVNGGSENYKYNVSGSFYRNDGIIMNSWMKRYTLRYASQIKISERMNFDMNMSYQNSERTNYDQDIYGQGILPPALYADPITPVYLPDTDNEYAGVNLSQTTNPVAAADRMQYNRTRVDQLVTNVGTNIEIIKGLTFDTKYGFIITYNRPKRYIPEYYIGDKDLNPTSSLDETHQRQLSWVNSNFLSYNKESGKHSIGLLAGQEWQYFDDYRTRVRTFDVPDDPNLYFATASPFATPADINQEPSNLNRYELQSTLFSFFGRINYAYDSRYLLTATVRRDATSKMAKDYRWGNFPSVSLGWNIKNESFMENLDLISNLKLRAGWGKTGNEGSVVDVYSNYALVSSGLYTMGPGGTLLEGRIQTVNPNEKLQWEVVKQYNFGLDFGLLNNKLNGSIDYYLKNTEGMIITVDPPIFAGTNASAANIGTMENSGLELSLNYRNFDSDLKYEIGGNITFLSKPMVTALSDSAQVILSGQAAKIRFVNRTIAGEEMAHFYGYKTDGLLTEADVATVTYEDFYPGQLKIVDLNGDGVIGIEDKTNIGSANPDFIYGFNIDLMYKGFDLKIFCQGVYGNELVNTLNMWLLAPDEGDQNLSTEVLDGWTEENRNTSVPRLVQGNQIFQGYYNDYLVEDASYFRLKNIQLGYTLPDNISEKLRMSRFRIYISAENLLTFTKYSGLDPEVGNFQFNSTLQRRDPLSQGLDDAIYPTAIRFLVGLNINF
jgi:TonB-linked SusC/RagA family outer membrane protein